jgi:hypothetical protein
MNKLYTSLAVGVLLLAVGVGRAEQPVAERQLSPAEVAAMIDPDGCNGHHSLHHHALLRWLTYCPEKPGLCECCHKCVPCCDPPLYLFFLCDGCCDGGYGCTACANCGGGCAHFICPFHREKTGCGGACGHP